MLPEVVTVLAQFPWPPLRNPTDRGTLRKNPASGCKTRRDPARKPRRRHSGSRLGYGISTHGNSGAFRTSDAYGGIAWGPRLSTRAEVRKLRSAARGTQHSLFRTQDKLLSSANRRNRFDVAPRECKQYCINSGANRVKRSQRNPHTQAISRGRSVPEMINR